MKNSLSLACMALVLGVMICQKADAEIKIGDTQAAVMAELGEPKGKMSLGRQLILIYPEGY
ncbi:MAG: hypothetical protein V2A34_14860, partial [Lentisphaerota bacterium]